MLVRDCTSKPRRGEEGFTQCPFFLVVKRRKGGFGRRMLWRGGEEKKCVFKIAQILRDQICISRNERQKAL